LIPISISAEGCAHAAARPQAGFAAAATLLKAKSCHSESRIRSGINRNVKAGPLQNTPATKKGTDIFDLWEIGGFLSVAWCRFVIGNEQY
jgi:hypothetical protein